MMQDNPDFIKLILSYSEDRGKNLANPGPYVRLGLNPELLPRIVKWIHRKNLRVSVHVETAADFHYAVIAGVDEIAHLPGYYIHNIEQSGKALLDKEDARMAAKKNIVVVTTTVLSKSILRDTTLLPLVQKYQQKNLELLMASGVVIAAGSDHSPTSIPEILNLAGLGVFTNRELLTIICTNTPQTIFPGKKIGLLEEGYKASFLVLDKNPLLDFNAISGINLRCKEGHLLPE